MLHLICSFSGCCKTNYHGKLTTWQAASLLHVFIHVIIICLYVYTSMCTYTIYIYTYMFMCMYTYIYIDNMCVCLCTQCFVVQQKVDVFAKADPHSDITIATFQLFIPGDPQRSDHPRDLQRDPFQKKDTKQKKKRKKKEKYRGSLKHGTWKCNRYMAHQQMKIAISFTVLFV